LELKYKEGMNQKAFDKKLMNLQNAAKEGNLQASVPHGVSKSERSSVTKSYRKALEKRINEMYKNNESARENALSKLRNSDIDHIIDLQLGGSNSSSNLRSLDSFTNQDLGRQIAQQLKDKNGNIISDIIKKLD
jgi:predicted metal-dependent hydrolase